MLKMLYNVNNIYMELHDFIYKINSVYFGIKLYFSSRKYLDVTMETVFAIFWLYLNKQKSF